MDSNQQLNCIIVDDEPAAISVLVNHLDKIDQVKVVGTCQNVYEAIRLVNANQVDLIFADINMPEISGLALPKLIDNHKVKIIFTTAYRKYAIEGFDLQAVDYLLKPISSERLLQGINKFLSEHILIKREEPIRLGNSRPNHIFVRSDRKMVKINFDDIRYIESYSDYVKLHLIDKRTIMTREQISVIEGKLPLEKFIRTHRSFIISFEHIDSFNNEVIEVGGKSVPISRTYKQQVLSRLV